MRSYFLVVCLFAFFSGTIKGQDEAVPIVLKNPSFEAVPVEGGKNMRFSLDNWLDCGAVGQTPPDIHPVPGGGQFGVTQKPADGVSYLGMVVRSDGTWETVSQKLESPLLEGKCYEFTISLCRSEKYLSGSSIDETQEFEYTTPARLRIWGGVGCNKAELLAESSLVISYRWLEYNFRFEPKSAHSYIILEAYYDSQTPSRRYNGNILLDKASAIIPVPCKVVEPEVEEPIVEEPVVEEPVVEEPVKKPKILQELEREKLREGQTIRIDQLYFAADSSAISSNSSEVLAEIYDFLASNPEVVVEIGGHTNGIPSHEYCDRLSTERAKAVVDYLTEKGIPRKRLEYKGYGKRNPVDTNKTSAGRKKNQRVEIKILSFNG